MVVPVSGLYRLYQFQPGGRVAGFVELKCGSDQDAIALAQKLARDGRHELWGGGKLLATLNESAGS